MSDDKCSRDGCPNRCFLDAPVCLGHLEPIPARAFTRKSADARPVVGVDEGDLFELLAELHHLRRQVQGLQDVGSQLVLQRQREIATLANLRAVEVLAREAYRQALQNNGKVTMGTWALLGDALDPVVGNSPS